MAVAVSIFLVCYAFIASEKLDKTLVAVLGAAAMVVSGAIPYPDALAKIDLNVVFLLVGMMIIVNIFGQTGLFEWVAIFLAKKARGRGVVLLPFFLVATGVCSAFLDNVTTVILMAPATILICQLLELPAPLFLALEAVFSNIGGTATLIGDPPNILIGSQSGVEKSLLGTFGTLNFNAFLAHLAPAVAVVGLLSLAVVMAMHRRKLYVAPAAIGRLEKADPRRAILEPRKLRRALAVFGLVLAGFFFGHSMGLDPGLTALAGAFLMALVCGMEPLPLLEKVEWNTIFFFVGLFMLIGGLEHQGVFEWLGRELVRLTEGHLFATALLVLWVAAFASAIVDNIPLVIAMIPLLHSVVSGFAAELGIQATGPNAAGLTAEQIALVRDHIHMPLFWCMALGACLGGNGSLIGASANVVVAQIAGRNGYRISFMQFTRMSLPLMILSLVICTGYVYVRYFMAPIPALAGGGGA